MLKPFLILSSVLLAGAIASTLQAQQAATPAPPAASPAAPAAFSVPLEAVNQVNPMKPTAESLARARSTVTSAPCAMERMGVAPATWPRT
jgi:hypothetical protein